MKSAAIVLAAAMIVTGAAAASAASMSQSSSGSTMARPANDTLDLTSTQRKTAWNDLSKSAAKQNEQKGFNARVGIVVPATLKIEPVPSSVATSIPRLRPYDFAMVEGKLVIVNPSDKKIVEVITG